MKRILIALFIFITLTANATTYHIAPNGSDASGNGSASSPWKTLSYACTKATSSGDIIHVNAGTYALTSSVSIPTGVSIEGDGLTSLITSSVTGSGSGAAAWTLKLSSSMGTNGNQHISNIKMDGQNLAAWGGIGINGRSNVKIYNCTFVNFLEVAVTFNGQAGYTEGAPGTFGTGNELHDCTVTNCAGYRGSNDYGAGNIMIGGQSGLLIYNNTIVQTARTGNVNGYLIKYYSGGYNKGIKIYNNYLETAPRAGTQATSSWGFVLEQWNPIGGWEIYGNTIKGCLDLVNVSKGSYAASFDIHDNTLGFDATPATGTTQGDVCIRLEAYFQSVNIYRNHFKNTVACVYASGENGNATSGLNMYSNIFDNIGGDNNTGWVFRYTNDGSTYTISNLNFWNNVMIAGSAHSTNYGITIPFGTVSNVSIRNNIIEGFDQGPVQNGASGSGSNVSIENNIFYSNGNSNNAAGSISYSSYTNQNNLKVDPLFVSSSDYHLQSSSPAIGKGIDVGLKTDYDGNAWKNPPSIGAYEDGSASSAQEIPVYQSSVVASSTPTIIKMVYDQSLTNIVPSVSAFNVQVNSVSRQISSVAIVDGNVQLTLVSRIFQGEVVKISYYKPSNNPIQTTSGGSASSLTNQSVINNCANISPITSVISPVNNSSFASPADITIYATASDPDGTISMVEFYNGSTKIGSSSAVPYSFIWNNVSAGSYSITAVATDNLNAKTTSSVMLVSVLNDQISQNEAPAIQISNPIKGNIYDQLTSITIAAIASDRDGTISKVEFYNGEVRLVELTSAPYTFTWKDVASGKYTITAIATDNQNATTVSAPVEFIVGSDFKYGTNSDLVNLYPNPNNGQFSIEFTTPLQNGRNEISITDLAGKLVYKKAVSNGEILKHFELAGIKSGMYVLIIKYMEILITKKFIIK